MGRHRVFPFESSVLVDGCLKSAEAPVAVNCRRFREAGAMLEA
jgi:hypothetical protein